MLVSSKGKERQTIGIGALYIAVLFSIYKGRNKLSSLYTCSKVETASP